MMRVLAWIAASAALLAVLLWAGNLDLQAEQAELSDYCAHVRAGIWPDYRELIKTGECAQAKNK